MTIETFKSSNGASLFRIGDHVYTTLAEAETVQLHADAATVVEDYIARTYDGENTRVRSRLTNVLTPFEIDRRERGMSNDPVTADKPGSEAAD